MIKYVLSILLYSLLLTGVCWGQVAANFRADTIRGCAPLIVTFTDESENAVSWSWDLGNATSTLQHPSTAYSLPGLYTIELIVTDPQGRKDSLVRQNYIEILPPPEVAFTYERTVFCEANTLTFSNSSTTSTPVSSYSWDFGDGTVSYQANPEKTFTQNGTYPVSLIIETLAGCSGFYSDSLNIQLFELDASFNGDSLVACGPPLSVNFTGNTFAGVQEYWEFGDGSTSTVANASHTYSALGSFSVTHIVMDSLGCSDTTILENYVNVGTNTLLIEADKEEVCLGESIELRAYAPAGSLINWEMGDGSPTIEDDVFSYTYEEAGQYSVNVTIDDGQGCLANRILDLIVYERPTPDFTMEFETTGCAPPYDVTFVDQTSDAVAWLWEFGDGSTSRKQHPSRTYFDEETHPVRLTATSSNGCTSRPPSIDSVSSPFLEAGFKADKRRGCIPLSITLSDSSNNGGVITSYEWLVEGLPISTEASPSFVLADTGRFDVQLIVENQQGCRDTSFVSDYLSTGEPPNVNFVPQADSVCANSSVLFANLSTGGDHYVWYFETGDSIVSFDLLQAFNIEGEITVKLVGSNKGCRASMTQTSSLFVMPPIADFYPSAYTVCELPAEISLTNLSIDADRYEWGLGGGRSSTNEHETVVFTEPGDYYISLKAINETYNCETFFALTIPVHPVKADFRLPDTLACAPYAATPINLSDPGSSLNWYFGEGDTLSSENPQYGYFHPGAYDISLIAENEYECKDTLIRENYLNLYKPQASFTADITVGCLPLTVSFQNLSQTQSSSSSYEWYMGDSTFYSDQNPIHTFTQSGYFDVELTVRDSLGCNQRIVKSNYIFATRPQPSFYAPFPENCPGNTVSFVNLSEGYGLAYEWDFGDGTTSTLANPEHIYESSGTYSVSLHITDVNGCDTTLIKEDYISINPISIGFSADTTYTDCPPLTVTFQADSTGEHKNISWIWDFGTGSKSFLPLAKHLYSIPGEYDIQLIGISESGCADTVLKEKLIHIEGPTGTFSFDPKAGCPGLGVSFEAVVDSNITVQWLTGDGTLLPEGEDTYLYPGSGVYVPIMALTDTTGCTTLIPSDTTVTIFPTPSLRITSSDTLICTGREVRFSIPDSQLSPIVVWNWNLGNNSSSLPEPIHTYEESGEYLISLTAENELGCVDSSQQSLNIQVIPFATPDIPLISRVNVAGETEIQIDFQADTLDSLYFKQYHLFREDESGSLQAVGSLDERNIPRFVDLDVQTSTGSYCYLVQTETLCGTQSPLEISGKHCSINIEHIPGEDRVEVFWTPYIGWNKVRAYKLYRTERGGDWAQELIGEVSGELTTFIDSSTFCEQAYIYHVKAISDQNLISQSDTTQGKAFHENPDQSFHMVNATVVDNENIQVEWEIPALKMWSELILEKRVGGAFSPIYTQNRPSGELKFIDEQVQVNEEFYGYRVQLVDSCGAVTPWGRTANSIHLSVAQNQGKVDLTWNPYEGWENGVENYSIERYQDSLGTYEEIVSLPSDSLHYEDSVQQVLFNQLCYRIIAHEAEGNRTSSLSNEECVTPKPVIFSPNAFSPNGDRVNDIFYFKGAFLDQFRVQIFNRWGELVFESRDIAEGWNGKLTDESSAPLGTYMFHIQGVSSEGNPIQKIGSIQLIR